MVSTVFFFKLFSCNYLITFISAHQEITFLSAQLGIKYHLFLEVVWISLTRYKTFKKRVEGN